MLDDEDKGKARAVEILEVEDEEQRQARMRECGLWRPPDVGSQAKYTPRGCPCKTRCLFFQACGRAAAAATTKFEWPVPPRAES